jgi:hypothetical protein
MSIYLEQYFKIFSRSDPLTPINKGISPLIRALHCHLENQGSKLLAADAREDGAKRFIVLFGKDRPSLEASLDFLLPSNSFDWNLYDAVLDGQLSCFYADVDVL